MLRYIAFVYTYGRVQRASFIIEFCCRQQGFAAQFRIGRLRSDAFVLGSRNWIRRELDEIRGTDNALFHEQLGRIGSLIEEQFKGAADNWPFGAAAAMVLLAMVLIGLQIAFGLSLLRFIEESGARFWTRLAPLAHRILPVRTPVHAIMLGMLWGWLPCGLVYSVLLMALLAADPGQSALLMAVFGLGTLPAMTLTGLAGTRLKLSLSRPNVRLAAGLILVLLGLWTGLGPLQHLAGGEHRHHHASALWDGCAIAAQGASMTCPHKSEFPEATCLVDRIRFSVPPMGPHPDDARRSA